MSDEHGNAIGDRNRHSGSALEGEMPVGFTATQPALPARSVHDDAVTMDLARGREARPGGCEIVAEAIPARHHVANGLVTGDPKTAGDACRRGGADGERPQLADL